MYSWKSRRNSCCCCRCGRAPIAAQHELADPDEVEIILEQLTEAGDALRRRDARPEHLDRLCAELVDEGARILRCRVARHARNGDEEETGGKPASGKISHHLGGTRDAGGGGAGGAAPGRWSKVYDIEVSELLPPNGFGFGRFSCSWRICAARRCRYSERIVA